MQGHKGAGGGGGRTKIACVAFAVTSTVDNKLVSKRTEIRWFLFPLYPGVE